MLRKIKREMARHQQVPHKRRRIKLRLMKVAATGGTVVMLTAMTVTPTLATGGMIVFDPQNYIQNLKSAIESVMQVENQYTQIANQIKQLANEAQNLTDGLDYSAEIMASYQNITNMQKYIEGLVTDYSQAMDVWDQHYPGFEQYSGMSAGESADRMLKMLQRSNDAIKASYQTNAIVMNNANTHQDNLRRLLEASRTAPGAKAALQTLAQISAEQCQLLQDMITQGCQTSNAQNGYYERVVQIEAKQKAEIDRFKYTEEPKTKSNSGIKPLPGN